MMISYSPSGTCTAATFGFWRTLCLPLGASSADGASGSEDSRFFVPSLFDSVFSVAFALFIFCVPFSGDFLFYSLADRKALARAGHALSVALCGALQFIHC